MYFPSLPLVLSLKHNSWILHTPSFCPVSAIALCLPYIVGRDFLPEETSDAMGMKYKAFPKAVWSFPAFSCTQHINIQARTEAWPATHVKDEDCS